MNPASFDDLTRALGATKTRRGLVRAFVAGVVAAGIPARASADERECIDSCNASNRPCLDACRETNGGYLCRALCAGSIHSCLEACSRGGYG
jgi:hypothetical protein